jgi:hypothetical protein
MSTILIYGLYDPRNGALRYLGKTKHALALRVTQHMAPKELRLQHRRAKWLRSLHSLGLRPEARVVEVTTAAEWATRERHWIAYHKANGARLVNGTDGGDGGATSKGKPCSEARRRAISAALKGHTVSEKSRRRFAEMCAALPMAGHNRVPLDDARLVALYVTQQKPATEIAQLLGVGDKPVLRRLHELGIARDRRAACALRGYRGMRGQGSRARTHKAQCKRGHDYTQENTYVDPRGRRSCRECMRLHRAGLAKKRQEAKGSTCV